MTEQAEKPLDNPQWENFARLYFEGKPADKAYTLAGFKSKYPNKNAARLFKKPEILARIRYFKSKAAVKAGITQEVQATKLEDLRIRCKQNGDSTGENAAIREQNKLYGLSIDKSQTEHTEAQAHRTEAEKRLDEEYAAWLLDREAQRKRALLQVHNKGA